MVFVVEPDLETGTFAVSWDDPSGGGITTQADTLADLAGEIREAVVCHFGGGPVPHRATLQFVSTELELA